jgi:hypothetical protein
VKVFKGITLWHDSKARNLEQAKHFCKTNQELARVDFTGNDEDWTYIGQDGSVITDRNEITKFYKEL